MPAKQVAAAVLCLAGALLLSLLLGQILDVPDEGALKNARFILAGDAMPPAEGRAWESAELPDSWSTSRRDAEGIGWYRLDFQVPAEHAGPLAVFIPRLSMNGEIFANGVRIHSGGRMSEPVTRNWNVPFYTEIPDPFVHAGRNVLDIRIFAYRNSNGGLGRVFVGDAQQMRERFTALQALHVKGAVVSFAVAALAAFTGAVAWLRIGREPVYGLFALAMLCWSARYANYFIQEAPANNAVYSLAVNSAQGWFFVFFTPFLLRMADLRWRWVEQGLLAAGIIGTAAIYAMFRGLVTVGSVALVWAFVWVPGSAALLLMSLRHAFHSRSPRSVIAAVAVWLYVPLTLRELQITGGILPFDASYVAHYVGIPLAVLIGWMLVDRAVDGARREAEAEVTRVRAVLDERQRITQDMHDGLGLQLNAALRVIEKGVIDRTRWAEMLRGCLDELRLIVDAASADSNEFLPLLANLRIRMQQRLESFGLCIVWRMERFPAGLRLAPESSLQVLRIVQETLNNAIKHSGASTIEFSVVDSALPRLVSLRIADNGGGFDSSGVAEGRGLQGMKRRAQKAGIGLVIESTGTGTTVQLDLPHGVRSPGSESAAGR